MRCVAAQPAETGVPSLGDGGAQAGPPPVREDVQELAVHPPGARPDNRK